MGTSAGRICVIGAGTSGLAMCRELVLRGADFDCIDKGSEVGGNWRIDNDNGAAAAYESLRTNVSRRRMEYPSTRMPRSYGDFVRHSDMATYLSEYADRHGIRSHLQLHTQVASVAPRAQRGWTVTTGSGARRDYSALVVATGKDAEPKFPDIPGRFAGRMMHSQAYRRPDCFTGERVLVVGAGNSACDIAVETSAVARSCDIAIRGAPHVLPRHLGGRPIDAANGPLANRLPWRVFEGSLALMLALSRGRYGRWGWPQPDHRVLGGVPSVSSTILPAVRTGAVHVRPAPVEFDGKTVRFGDGSTGEYDAVVFATGYRITFPFFDDDVTERLGIDGACIPLYRHIVPPNVGDLFFIGLVDPLAGHPPVVEAQAAWIGAALHGEVTIPPRVTDPPQRRVQVRFSNLRPHSILVDRFAYPRLLAADRRSGR